MLVERGELAYEQRVADVWPGFSAHGKDGLTPGDVLVHTAGVPGLWPQITPEDLCDWERVCAFIAGQEPWWTPGTETGYHALTWGVLLGELARRATGRTLAQVLRDEVTAPLGIAEEPRFGVPPQLLKRVARAGPEGATPPPPDHGWRSPRLQRAISIASNTIGVRICPATRQPTIIRENASTMKHTYATPARVATNVRSVTHSSLGRLAVNWRLTRSGCRPAPTSGRVVLTRRVRSTPQIPARRISRAVWSRPTSIPARLAVFHNFLAP